MCSRHGTKSASYRIWEDVGADHVAEEVTTLADLPVAHASLDKTGEDMQFGFMSHSFSIRFALPCILTKNDMAIRVEALRANEQQGVEGDLGSLPKARISASRDGEAR